jgi:branched-chain amino acid aminotransferase
MPMNKSDVIWFDGNFVPWDEAKVHVLSHALHYGSSVFEGIRCYETESGPAVFCLGQHIKRMYNSCKIYRIEVPYSSDQISDAILETIRRNNLHSSRAPAR